MKKRSLVLGALLAVGVAISVPPARADSKDSARIEKLEEQVRNLESRFAKMEESHSPRAGMKQGMGMGHDAMKQGMGMAGQQPDSSMVLDSFTVD